MFVTTCTHGMLQAWGSAQDAHSLHLFPLVASTQSCPSADCLPFPSPCHVSRCSQRGWGVTLKDCCVDRWVGAAPGPVPGCTASPAGVSQLSKGGGGARLDVVPQ